MTMISIHTVAQIVMEFKDVGKRKSFDGDLNNSKVLDFLFKIERFAHHFHHSSLKDFETYLEKKMIITILAHIISFL